MKNDRVDLFHVERIQLTSARRSPKTVSRHNGTPETEPRVPRGTLPPEGYDHMFNVKHSLATICPRCYSIRGT